LPFPLPYCPVVVMVVVSWYQRGYENDWGEGGVLDVDENKIRTTNDNIRYSHLSSTLLLFDTFRYVEEPFERIEVQLE
jgi:hypothetical protein